MPVRSSLSPGLVWAGLQLMLGLTWVVYALFLPKLASAAGLPLALVPWLLVIDQLVFALTDPWAGAASDRAADQARRIGPTVAGVTTLSAIAFVALPMMVAQVPPVVLAVLLFGWAIGTAALRAPLAALLSRQPGSADGVNAALLASGIALAGVAGGLVVPALRDVSPSLAFAVVAGATALVAWLAIPAERIARAEGASRAAGTGPSNPTEPLSFAGSSSWRAGGAVLTAAGLLAMGQQLQTAVVAPAIFTAFGAPRLAVVFWMGAALACGLYLLLRSRIDSARLSAAAALFGALMLAAFGLASSASAAAPAHGSAGLAWGLVLAAIIDAMLGFGRARGQGGLAAGLLFGLFAAIALVRLALGALGVWSSIGPQAALWGAALCWGLAGLLMLMRGRPRAAALP